MTIGIKVRLHVADEWRWSSSSTHGTHSFDIDSAIGKHWNLMRISFHTYLWSAILIILIFYCRTSLRLGNLFGMNQRYHQIALRLHPAGVVYLTVRYTQLSEAYNRYQKWNKIQWLNRLNVGGVEWNVNKIRTISRAYNGACIYGKRPYTAFSWIFGPFLACIWLPKAVFLKTNSK